MCSCPKVVLARIGERFGIGRGGRDSAVACP